MGVPGLEFQGAGEVLPGAGRVVLEVKNPPRGERRGIARIPPEQAVVERFGFGVAAALGQHVAEGRQRAHIETSPRDCLGQVALRPLQVVELKASPGAIHQGLGEVRVQLQGPVVTSKGVADAGRPGPAPGRGSGGAMRTSAPAPCRRRNRRPIRVSDPARGGKSRGRTRPRTPGHRARWPGARRPRPDPGRPGRAATSPSGRNRGWSPAECSPRGPDRARPPPIAPAPRGNGLDRHRARPGAWARAVRRGPATGRPPPGPASDRPPNPAGPPGTSAPARRGGSTRSFPRGLAFAPRASGAGPRSRAATHRSGRVASP